MQNKPKKRWLDAQIVIASVAIAFTLALWNVFAKASFLSNNSGTPPAIPPTPDPTFTFTYVPTGTGAPGLSAVHLPEVHLLLGGKPPVAKVVVLGGSGNGSTNFPGSSGSNNSGNTAAASSASSGSGNSGGGSPAVSNPAPAPVPVTTTKSSKP